MSTSKDVIDKLDKAIEANGNLAASEYRRLSILALRAIYGDVQELKDWKDDQDNAKKDMMRNIAKGVAVGLIMLAIGILIEYFRHGGT